MSNPTTLVQKLWDYRNILMDGCWLIPCGWCTGRQDSIRIPARTWEGPASRSPGRAAAPRTGAAGSSPRFLRVCRSAGPVTPILSLSIPPGVTPAPQRQTLDRLKELNLQHRGATGDPEIATRINSFELAFRMQTSGPELMDLGKETQETLERYGAEPGKPGYAMNCLLARRFVARCRVRAGVRPTSPSRGSSARHPLPTTAG